jgi:hypothetical protein
MMEGSGYGSVQNNVGSGFTTLHEKKITLFAVVKLGSKRKKFGGIGTEIGTAK